MLICGNICAQCRVQLVIMFDIFSLPCCEKTVVILVTRTGESESDSENLPFNR